jgi:DnaJ-class molecular chaperone
MIAGDLIIVIKAKEEFPQSNWIREGDHLIYSHNITLFEALTGYNFYLCHLDKRIINICSEEGVVTQSGKFGDQLGSFNWGFR